jgi:benzoyl-CoA reductase/2-hydroxyglutaryl-CoA dehydratase subunit BcrC/BadD/HgdB
MSALERLVDDALRDPLATARAHCAAGGRVIGFAGGDVPVELISAAGAFALRLPSFAGVAGSAADQYLESSFAPDIRSMTEQYLHGDLDFLEAIVFSRADDSAQRLYYYLSELRRQQVADGPLPLIFDLAKIPRATSGAHSRAAMAKLAAELGVRPQHLAAGIERRNRRRRLFTSLARLRQGAGSVRGCLAERLGRAADFCDADAYDAALGAWLANEGASATPVAGPRLILIGNVPPDDRLHAAAEATGGNIVAEWGEHLPGSAAMPPVASHGSLDDIADHYHDRAAGPRAFMDRAASAAYLVRAAAADGAIIWLVEQEEAMIWDVPAQTQALQAAGVPVLSLVRRRWDGADALSEIGEFTRDLGVRR